MPYTFGEFNPALTAAIRQAAARGTIGIEFTPHSEDEMEDDGFDHDDVLSCLRRGQAYGPETVNGELRSNVIHRGLHIRVAVANIGLPPFTNIQRIRVVTVMRTKS